MEEHGIDTVFRVYNPLRDGAPETYLLEEWVTVRSDAINTWIGFLKNGVPKIRECFLLNRKLTQQTTLFPQLSIFILCVLTTPITYVRVEMPSWLVSL